MKCAAAILSRLAFRRPPAQQVRQLGDVGGDAPSLIFGQQVGGRLSAGIVLEVEIAERLTVLVAEKHALFNSSTVERGGKRREACSISPQR